MYALGVDSQGRHPYLWAVPGELADVWGGDKMMLRIVRLNPESNVYDLVIVFSDGSISRPLYTSGSIRWLLEKSIERFHHLPQRIDVVE